MVGVIKAMDELISQWDHTDVIQREYVLSEIERMSPLHAAYFGMRFGEHYRDETAETNVFANLIERREDM